MVIFALEANQHFMLELEVWAVKERKREQGKEIVRWRRLWDLQWHKESVFLKTILFDLLLQVKREMQPLPYIYNAISK